jgi:regulator of sirC expression with transglutaminase-like and TPR domain
VSEFVRRAQSAPEPLPLDVLVAAIAVEEDPELEGGVEGLIARIDQLAAGLRVRPGAPLVEHVARLNHHLFTTHGFAGDDETYDAPANSHLHRVLDRRRGLPILLSVVYIEVARRVGVVVDPVAFPSHFVVSPRDADEAAGALPRFFVDPFHGGAIRTAQDLRRQLEGRARRAIGDDELTRWLAPASTRDVLLRINNNLQRSHLFRAELEAALRATVRNLWLRPDDPELRRDRGLLRLELGLGDDEDDLGAYVLARPDAKDTPYIRAKRDEGGG